MKKPLTLCLFLALLISTTFCATALAQTRPLSISSPKEDNSTVTQATVYFQGMADPSGTLYLAGEPVKIYSTGVFAAPIRLQPGVNELEVRYQVGQQTQTRKLIINRVEPERPQPTDGFAIESARILPGGDEIWLQEGDRLQVEMKASPGMTAVFFHDIPMQEQPLSVAGVAGIYRGEYRIKSGDRLQAETISFKITDPQTKKSITQTSKQKITFLVDQPTLIGATNKRRTALGYGLGADRLGGAKMGFVDSLVRLEITGKMQDMYRVRLASQQQAYVDTRDLDIIEGILFRPQSLTGSWSVTSNGTHDQISIGLSQRLPYVSIMEENPARIVVDIFGAVSNSNWITQREGLVAIKNVWYEQISEDIFRATIELKDDQHWGHAISYTGNALTIRVKPQPRRLSIKNLRIAVDAGHGGSNRGAVGMTGVLEKDLNLSMAHKLRQLLEKQGAEVMMTRSDDTYTNNTQRLGVLKEYDPDILISIHCNAAGNPMVQGASTYYRHQAFRPLTQYIYDEMLPLGLADFGNVGGFNFTLNSPTEYPSVLVEVAFMSNPADEERLLDPDFHDDIAKSIVDGLEKFLNASEKNPKKQ